MPKRGPAGSMGITGALLQNGVGDLVVNVLLEHVLVRELYVPVEILPPGRLAKADELVVDDAILSVVELSLIRIHWSTPVDEAILDVVELSIDKDTFGNHTHANIPLYGEIKTGFKKGTVRELCQFVNIRPDDIIFVASE